MSSSSTASPSSYLSNTYRSSSTSTSTSSSSSARHPSLCTNIYCLCRTVSSISPRTPTIARVQLNPYVQTTTLDLTTIYTNPSSPESDFSPMSQTSSSTRSRSRSSRHHDDDDNQDNPRAHDFDFDELFDWYPAEEDFRARPQRAEVGASAAAAASSSSRTTNMTTGEPKAPSGPDDFSYSHYGHKKASATAPPPSQSPAPAASSRIVYSRSGFIRPVVHLRSRTSGRRLA